MASSICKRYSLKSDGTDYRGRLVKPPVACSSHTWQNFRELGNSIQGQHHQKSAHNIRNETRPVLGHPCDGKWQQCAVQAQLSVAQH
jgi:hypothetical protein